MSIKAEITVDTKKYFHGFSTIQLFDKNTGKLVKQVKHENTYNDRLQFINYLNTIVRKTSSIMHSTITGWQQSQESYFNEDTYFQHYCKPNNDSTGFFLYGHLVLTNNTADENAHGYFNGIPVAYCNTGNVLPTLKQALSCVGTINLNESYLGNDRLHLVFDFSTDKANVTFDSLWLIPSFHVNTSNIAPPSSMVEKMLLEKQKVTTLATTADTIYSCPYIQGRYSILYEKTRYNYGVGQYVYSIRIMDIITGDIETYDLGTEYDIGGAPFYYDKVNKKLYTIYIRAADISYILDGSDESYLSVFDLTTKTLTKINNLSTMLNLTTSALSFSSTSSFSTATLYYQGSPRLIFTITGTDSNSGITKTYLLIYSFDVTTQTFTLLKKHEVRINPNCTNDFYMSYNTQIDKYFYMYNIVALDTGTPTGNDTTVIDLTTGELVSISCIDFYNLQQIYLSYNDFFSSDNYYYYGYRVGYTILDTSLFRVPLYLFNFPIGTIHPVTPPEVHKDSYFSANWTTHNKLSAPITKTDQTTMKIQYDIVFDSLPETIVPALL